ncbi:hypothetical protein BGX28_007969 [Mortierella sp. GBA30]|nr:hypothetical protein BGX28_007969 [Mortierella sp. GBA30]
MDSSVLALSNGSTTSGADSESNPLRLLTFIAPTTYQTSVESILHADVHADFPVRLGPVAVAELSVDDDELYLAAGPLEETAPTATPKSKKGRPKKTLKPKRTVSTPYYTQPSAASVSAAPSPPPPTDMASASSPTHTPAPTTASLEINVNVPTAANPTPVTIHINTPLTTAPHTTGMTVPTPNISVQTASPTTLPVTTTTTTVTTTTTTAAAITTTATSTSTSHITRPTKTTTAPWLPSSIVPIAAPSKATSTPSPGTSLPDVVIPNLHPTIPDNSINVQLRLERVSYAQVIDNGILAAQLVSFLPAQLSHLLDVDPELILVLAIRDGSSNNNNNNNNNNGAKRKRDLMTSKNASDAILVTIAIPRDKYWTLDTLVQDRSSMLYFPSATGFGQFVDPQFPLSANPPSKVRGGGSGQGEDNEDDSSADPLTGGGSGIITNPNNKTDKSGTNNGPVIGSVVGLATAAYVGIALLVMRRYRRKKIVEQEHEQLRQSISAPVHVSGSTQAWGWHGS